MTTSAWIYDYEKRVQEWRNAAEQKKSVAGRALLVSAPPALAGVVAIDAPVEPGDLKSGFCSVGAPVLPPPIPDWRKLGRASGQIFPIPEQKPVKDILDYGWIGALLSGAAIALLIFAVIDPSGFFDIINSGGAGQANIVRAVSPSAVAPVLENISLEKFVETAAHFFERF
jgi:hypothetical protein